MKFIIHGGKPLQGEIKLAGSKNASTKMMVASLLTDEECVLENFPEIGETAITAELCKAIGSDIKKDGSSLSIKTRDIKSARVTSLSRRNRIPILALGPLLIRAHEAEVPFVGGDRIGPRPVDMHIQALESLGAAITLKENTYYATAPNGLHGGRVELKYPSVGATENTLLASVLAHGKTVIENAATEPEIIDLMKMLQSMGAIIELGANRRIYIEGVENLRGVRHTVLPDRNEAVSFACLAIATNGSIFVAGAIQEHLLTFLNTIRRIGADYEVREGGIRFWRAHALKGVSIETDTHPGFMTDWQQPLTVVLTQSEGESRVHETVYEDRFGYIQDLNLMGANIRVVGECLGDLVCRFRGSTYKHSIIITGPTKLSGTKLHMRDARAGMAHLVAALTAKGGSEIDGVEEVDRAYERIDERLGALGADIKRVD